MAEITKSMQANSLKARQANAKRRQRLAKKLGVLPGELMPYRIEETIKSGRIKRSDVPEEMLPKEKVEKAPRGEVLIPSHAIPAGLPKLTREAREKIDFMSAKQLQHLAKLIVAVAREL